MRFYALIQITELHDEYREGRIQQPEIPNIINKIWENIEKPNHAFYANILFPSDSLHGTGDKDTVRREIAPLAEILLYSMVGKALARSQS